MVDFMLAPILPHALLPRTRFPLLLPQVHLCQAALQVLPPQVLPLLKE